LIRFSLGELQLTILDGGSVWLDGGSMFGVVPRVLWERQRTPDERHRIELAMNLLLIETGKQRILVDTGAGDQWDEKSLAIYGLQNTSASELLAPAGLRPEQIDLVINTHLHFDHAGGNTTRDAEGSQAPAFSNARYVVQKSELETARMDNERIRASYLPRYYDCLEQEDDRLWLVDGEVDLLPGVRLTPVPGHTPGMQMVRVEGGESTLAYLADLVPTASHLAYPWIMGFDLEPLVTLATKKKILPSAVREGWTVLFEHDRSMPLARIEARGDALHANSWHPES